MKVCSKISALSLSHPLNLFYTIQQSWGKAKQRTDEPTTLATNNIAPPHHLHIFLIHTFSLPHTVVLLRTGHHLQFPLFHNTPVYLCKARMRTLLIQWVTAHCNRYYLIIESSIPIQLKLENTLKTERNKNELTKIVRKAKVARCRLCNTLHHPFIY